MLKFVDVTTVLPALRQTLREWLGTGRTHLTVRQAGSLCREAVKRGVAEPAWLGRRRRRRKRRTIYATA